MAVGRAGTCQTWCSRVPSGGSKENRPVWHLKSRLEVTVLGLGWGVGAVASSGYSEGTEATGFQMQGWWWDSGLEFRVGSRPPRRLVEFRAGGGGVGQLFHRFLR